MTRTTGSMVPRPSTCRTTSATTVTATQATTPPPPRWPPLPAATSPGIGPVPPLVNMGTPCQRDAETDIRITTYFDRGYSPSRAGASGRSRRGDGTVVRHRVGAFALVGEQRGERELAVGGPGRGGVDGPHPGCGRQRLQCR